MLNGKVVPILSATILLLASCARDRHPTSSATGGTTVPYLPSGPTTESPSRPGMGQKLTAEDRAWAEAMVGLRLANERKGKAAKPTYGRWYRTAMYKCPKFKDDIPVSRVFDAKSKGKDGKPIWFPAEGLVDGKPFNFEEMENAACYFYRTITVEKKTSINLSLGSDDGISVWLNGKEILSHDIPRGLAPDQELLTVRLKKGVNHFVARIHNGISLIGFYFKQVDMKGVDRIKALMRQFPKQCEWIDAGSRGSFDFDAYIKTDREPTLEAELVDKVLGELNEDSFNFQVERDYLRIDRVGASDPRWWQLYARIRRRVIATHKFAVLKHTEEIIYAVRNIHGDGHWYANFAYYAEGPHKVAYGRGIPAQLVRANLKSGKRTILLEDKIGGIRDPQVHYDANKILFSYRKGGEAQYHLYEINIDGAGLRQITDGIYDDIEPTYLPDGGIAFVSTRAKRWVNCWKTQVGTIYRCDPDPSAEELKAGGKNLRMLSCNVEGDNTPWVLPDGRIMYMRWEYVDRNQLKFHHLWTMNPDGTNQMVAFGNMHPGSVFIDAKPIPGTSLIVMSDSRGHGRREHEGRMATLSLRLGPDDRSAMNHITRDAVKDPYGLGPGAFLAVTKRPDGISFIDGRGQASVIIKGKYDHIHEPRPLRPRKRERILPDRTDRTKTTGTLVLQDVTIGRNMKGVKKGDITKLLILESLPKPINYGGFAWDFVPVSWGGSFTLERILGTVPVEPDGSAHFEVPAMRPLVFVALDENNVTVKRMHSFLTVQPGETMSCIGCHEDRAAAPPSPNIASLAAMRRGPSKVTPIPDVPSVIDYPRHIQPIWDKHCVSCHNPDKLKGDIDLSADYGPAFMMSFIELFNHGQISDNRNGNGNTAPRSVGDVKSAIMQKLDGSHFKAKLSKKEVELVRNWIHIGAPQIGTYAALGTGMLADRYDIGCKVPESMLGGVKEMRQILDRRCGECHKTKGVAPCLPEITSKRNWRGTEWRQLPPGKVFDRVLVHRLYNLSRPEKSRILTAPLAKKAGGHNMQKYDKAAMKPVGKIHEVFPSKDDPDYKALLKVIQDAHAYIQKDKRWHMEGFRPNPDYVREMIRYGILPESTTPKDVTNVYAVDEAYWRMFWQRPPEKQPKLHANPKIHKQLRWDHTQPKPKPTKSRK